MTGGIEIAEFRAADFSQNGRGHGHAMELIRLARIAVQEIEKLIADGGDGQGPVGPISIKGGERTESWAPMPDHEPAPEPAPEGWAYASTQAAELRKLVEEMSELLAKPNHPRKALETVLERLSHDLGGEADTAASVVHDWANEWRERKHGEGRE